MTMNYRIDSYDGVKSSVVVFHDGELHTAHVGVSPNFALIVERLEADPSDTSVVDLFNLERAVSTAFERVSAHITVKNGEVLYDGDRLHNGVSKQILRLVDENSLDRAKAVAAFAEKVMTNPQEHSREQLFTWLERHDFTITESGDFVGYKGCYDENGVPVSSRPAPAKDKVTVNGQDVSGVRVPNTPGDVVEMPRSLVDFNAGVGCSVGLHVGTYAYATSFAPVLLEVHVDPRDVVSVPTDCDAQKIRTCRYTVVGPIDAEYAEAVLPAGQVEGYDDFDEADDDEFDAEWERYEDEPEVNEGFSEGDTVRTTVELYGAPRRILPGEAATVVSVVHNGWLNVRFADGVQDTWVDFLFQKVEPAESDDLEDALENLSAAVQKVRDTRQNHLAQKRYPKGHDKAGQFIPKDSPDYKIY